LSHTVFKPTALEVAAPSPTNRSRRRTNLAKAIRSTLRPGEPGSVAAARRIEPQGYPGAPAQIDPISYCHEPGRAELISGQPLIHAFHVISDAITAARINVLMQAQQDPRKSWTPRGGPCAVQQCGSCACDLNEYKLDKGPTMSRFPGALSRSASRSAIHHSFLPLGPS
jgi:hypothetical protein